MILKFSMWKLEGVVHFMNAQKHLVRGYSQEVSLCTNLQYVWTKSTNLVHFDHAEQKINLPLAYKQ